MAQISGFVKVVITTLLDNNTLKFDNGSRLKQAGFLAEGLREE
jgi:hypothetical protein